MWYPLFPSPCPAHQSAAAGQSTARASSRAPRVPLLRPPWSLPYIGGQAEEEVSLHSVANRHHSHMNERCFKSADCQKRCPQEIQALSNFCLQCFSTWDQRRYFCAKRWGEALGIQALMPPLQLSTFQHSHGERKEEMPPLSRAKRLQLISLSPNAPPTA